MPTPIQLDELADAIALKIKNQLQVSRPQALCKDPHACERDGCGSCGHCAVKQAKHVRHFLGNGARRISANPGIDPVASDIAKAIDHTLLKPDATREELDKLCEEAVRYGFATVCVNPANVAYAARRLAGTPVKPITVVGFPLGASTAQAKTYEARQAIRNGAREIDMVINIGALKSGDYEAVYTDIVKVVEAVRPYPVKVILETASLNNEEKIIACVLAKLAKAQYVKTSTGFGKGGATLEDVTLMRRIVGRDMGVKASGGIRSQKDAKQMLAAGANRLGASASVEIITGKNGRNKGY